MYSKNTLHKHVIITRKKAFLYLTLITFLFLGTTIVYAADFKNGEADFRKTNFEDINTSVELTGEWAFYWKKLLNPHQISEGVKPDYYSKLTKTWDKHEQLNLPFKAFGYATYSLDVYVDHKKNPQLAFFLPATYSSYKLWINGKEFAKNGIVADNKKDYKAHWLPIKKLYIPSSDTLHLVLQIANYDHYRGGISQAIIMGNADYIERMWATELAITLILTGILTMVTLIFFGLYFLGQRDEVVVFFAMYCFFYIYRLIGVDKIYYVHQLFPNIDFRITFFLEYFTIFFCIYLFTRFLRAFYSGKNLVLKYIGYISLFYIGLLILCPVYLISYLSQFFFFVILFFVVYNIYRSAIAVYRKRRGSLFSLLSMLSIGTSVTLNILSYFGFLEPTPLYLFFGYFGFILFQTLILSHRFVFSFRKARQEAEQGGRAKSEFLANMSHEIRTPLNGVIGFTDLLMKTKLDNTQKQYMSTVFQSANSLLDIINDILDFSKIEAGKLELSVEKSDILELVSQVADMVAFQASQKNLEMLLNIPADIPRFIWVDIVRLRQILVNLLSNAVKFTETGEIELKVELLEGSKTHHRIFRFSVTDTGIGIDPKNQERIFNAFSQEDTSTTRKFGGTGLGLTISNKLLGLMKSELHVESELGKGTKFYFDLSLRSQQGEVAEWENQGTFKNVLVVDDNQNNRTLVKNMLEIQEINSVEAENGKVAIEILQSGQKFDLMIVDYHMPYIDGLETVREIRKNPEFSVEKLPVLMLYSSASDDYISQESQKLQIGQTIVKPIKIQQLYHALFKISGQGADDEQVVEAPKPENYVDTREHTLLIVEDNQVNMLFAKTILKSIFPKSRILSAENGRIAVDMFRKDPPDIIFMDMQMPEMNGYEATLEIRSIENNKSRVPIIALTAGTVKGEKEKCLEAGMDDYITKPFVKDNIVKVVQQHLV
ncbi:response regulator [Emticicia sp. CRIBPO]|uniref:response regulator n=1 Tax=Emticicia sp. CRIBPO TaxID=2683258 RepID=UPI001411D3B8|nr:response regulator [Emticicia sp. CRIBPO]NBA88590.1 response regulator [Emticicia sp. CRIBPO]